MPFRKIKVAIAGSLDVRHIRSIRYRCAPHIVRCQYVPFGRLQFTRLRCRVGLRFGESDEFDAIARHSPDRREQRTRRRWFRFSVVVFQRTEQAQRTACTRGRDIEQAYAFVRVAVSLFVAQPSMHAVPVSSTTHTEQKPRRFRSPENRRRIVDPADAMQSGNDDVIELESFRTMNRHDRNAIVTRRRFGEQPLHRPFECRDVERARLRILDQRKQALRVCDCFGRHTSLHHRDV